MYTCQLLGMSFIISKHEQMRVVSYISCVELLAPLTTSMCECSLHIVFAITAWPFECDQVNIHCLQTPMISWCLQAASLCAWYSCTCNLVSACTRGTARMTGVNHCLPKLLHTVPVMMTVCALTCHYFLGGFFITRLYYKPSNRKRDFNHWIQ